MSTQSPYFLGKLNGSAVRAAFYIIRQHLFFLSRWHSNQPQRQISYLPSTFISNRLGLIIQ